MGPPPSHFMGYNFEVWRLLPPKQIIAIILWYGMGMADLEFYGQIL